LKWAASVIQIGIADQVRRRKFYGGFPTIIQTRVFLKGDVLESCCQAWIPFYKTVKYFFFVSGRVCIYQDDFSVTLNGGGRNIFQEPLKKLIAIVD